MLFSFLGSIFNELSLAVKNAWNELTCDQAMLQNQGAPAQIPRPPRKPP